MFRVKAFSVVAVVVSFCLFSVGCDSKPKAQSLVDSNIKRVRSFYGIYMSAHSLTGPKNKEDLIEFLSTDATAKIKVERLGVEIDQIEDCFISERDEEPFEIRWGLTGFDDHAIVFEKTGVDGKRMVAFSKPRELDEAEYQKYFSGKKVDEQPELPGVPQ